MERPDEEIGYNLNRYSIIIILSQLFKSSSNKTDMSTNITISEYTDESCDFFYFIVQGIIGFVVCSVGLVGNFLSLLTIHTIGKSSVTLFLFRSLAIIDTLYLATYGLVIVASAIMLYFGQVEEYYSNYQNFVYWIFPFSAMTFTVTAWVTALLTIHR